MLIAENRPRNLSWIHAGPLLFGDWGTSRLYVLGLAFFFSGHASVFYLGAMSLIMAVVAWAYSVICRCFQDGGGVYSSARQVKPVLAVIGATLLLCDYIVTASLSTVEAFHYFGVPEGWVLWSSIGTIVLLGVVNWFGARSAGRFALVIALAAMAVSFIVALFCIPFIKEGLQSVSLEGIKNTSNWGRWESLVKIMLALSGVEAVSNMTGLMKQPVARTAKRTIWPVLAEVCVLNIVFGLALTGLPGLKNTITPDYQTHVVSVMAADTKMDENKALDAVPDEVKAYRDTAVRVLAIESGKNALGPSAGLIFGRVCAVIFGLLLLSATNTVIVDMISVTYSMARDRELPRIFAKLNYSGVPLWGVVFAVVSPCVVLLFVQDVVLLGELYAVGVVGAICINVLCCVVNKKIDVSRWERRGLLAVGLLMLATELTIIGTKHHAAMFALGMVGVVLAARQLVRWYAPPEGMAVPEPQIGWLAELKQTPAKLDPSKPKILLATRGVNQAEFAVGLAKRRGAILFAIFVRTLRVQDVGPRGVPQIEDDREAQASLGAVAVLAREAGVALFPIYVVAADPASEILDYSVTYGCDTVIVGRSRRSVFSRRVTGDVVQTLTESMPEGITLMTRA